MGRGLRSGRGRSLGRALVDAGGQHQLAGNGCQDSVGRTCHQWSSHLWIRYRVPSKRRHNLLGGARELQRHGTPLHTPVRCATHHFESCSFQPVARRPCQGQSTRPQLRRYRSLQSSKRGRRNDLDRAAASRGPDLRGSGLERLGDRYILERAHDNGRDWRFADH